MDIYKNKNNKKKNFQRSKIIQRGIFESNEVLKKVKNLETESLHENFWKNKNIAQKVLKEKKFLEDILKSFNNLVNDFQSSSDLIEMAIKENDNEVFDDCEKKIVQVFKDIKKVEVKCFLSKENDHLDIYLEIHAGAGGTESQDWVEMLRRMYLKWSEKKQFNYEIISEHKGDEAGFKSTTIKITGTYVYGLLNSESGVHRLVRISPFDSGARRHTSFASVWVYPVIDDNINIEIKEKDLRIDTYRSSGAGGQHVNTTDSAVRITHLPTKYSCSMSK